MSTEVDETLITKVDEVVGSGKTGNFFFIITIFNFYKFDFCCFIVVKKELTSVDVLVCGLCHIGFHFVEEFQEHKLGGECKKVSAFREQKEKVYLFTI